MAKAEEKLGISFGEDSEKSSEKILVIIKGNKYISAKEIAKTKVEEMIEKKQH